MDHEYITNFQKALILLSTKREYYLFLKWEELRNLRNALIGNVNIESEWIKNECKQVFTNL